MEGGGGGGGGREDKQNKKSQPYIIDSHLKNSFNLVPAKLKMTPWSSGR